MPRFLLAALTLFSLGTSLFATEFDTGKLSELRAAIRKSLSAHLISGAVVVVGSKTGVAHTEVDGSRNLATDDKMTADTVFRIASMTKPIVALAVMQLQDAGRLNVNDPVEKHLPEFTGQWLNGGKADDGGMVLKKPSRPITIRDLLTHTSGLPGNYPTKFGELYFTRHLTLAQSIYMQSQRSLDFEPGTKWAYCNAGIDTLGRIVEVISGQPFETYLQQSIFHPLGMHETECFIRPDQRPRIAVVYESKDGKLIEVQRPLIGLELNAKHPMPAGGLVSTATDLAKLYQCLLNGGELHGRRIIQAATLAEMTKTQTGDLATGFVDGMSFGYGFAVVKEPKGVNAMLSTGTYGHGGAFGTQGWVDPKQDLFVIILVARAGMPGGDGHELRRAVQEIAVDAIKK
ncbi:MAG TPA: serine hydrolase domain-containing protein [Planctomycetaceae bacterium]|nr:serine hydrolase domain-containing protein [Planctomycetaceae bacterium]